MDRGYNRSDIGISQSKMLRIQMKDKFLKWLKNIEKQQEGMGQAMDKNY